MVRLYIKNRKVSIEADPGINVGRLMEEELGLGMICQGNGTCGRCKVRVLKGERDNVNEREDFYVDRSKGERLACQMTLEEDTELEYFEGFNEDCLSFQDLRQVDLDSSIKIGRLKVNKSRERPLGETVKEDLNSLYIYQRLGDLDHDLEEHIGILHGRELLDLRKNLAQPILGLAIDLGTTTLSFYMVNLIYGDILGKYSLENPIMKMMDEDLISGQAQLTKSQLQALNQALLGQIEEGVGYLLGTNYQEEDIYHYVLGGCNFTNHVFLGVNPRLLCDPIDTSVFWRIDSFKGRELGLLGNPNSIVDMIPSSSNDLGGDLIAGLINLEFYREERALYLDIGNTAELVAIKEGQLFGTRLSENLGFRGVKRAWGSVLKPGSILFFDLDDQYRRSYKTMSNGSPQGICGSGYIHILSSLVQRGLVERDGSFNSLFYEKCGDYIKDDRFYLTDQVYIREGEIQDMVEEVGKIYGGALRFLEEIDLDLDQVDNIYIGGLFGYRKEAIQIDRLKLVPEDYQGGLHLMGNGSLEGLRIILTNRHYFNIADKLAQRIKTIEV